MLADESLVGESFTGVTDKELWPILVNADCFYDPDRKRLKNLSLGEIIEVIKYPSEGMSVLTNICLIIPLGLNL